MSLGVFTRPGEQSLTMSEYEEQRRRKRIWLGIAFAILVVVILVVILALTAFKARPPRAEVNSIDVETVGVGDAGSLTLLLLLDLTVHNPNRARFRYADSAARAWCGGAPVGMALIPPGIVPANADEFLSVLLFMEAVPVAGNEGNERVRVGATTTLVGVVKVLGVFRHRVVATTACDITVSVANASVLSFFSQSSGNLSVVFTEAPASVTSRNNASFAFAVADGNGTNPCAAPGNCSFTCQLDQLPVSDCGTGRALFSALADGEHSFSFAVKSSSGAFGATVLRWTIDTVAPTAVVIAAQNYTNGQTVTVNITFSETCTGFVCANSSFCDLWIFGDGAVLPSTLKELEKARRYSLEVALNSTVATGKATAVIARDACVDAAGNLLQRTPQSSFPVHFDRTVPSVSLSTPVPTSEVIIANERRTCEATNNASDLMIYLNFNAPVQTSPEELLRFLSVSSGSLAVMSRKTDGNRRFTFVLRNVANLSVVTVSMAENAVLTRYGTPVAGNLSRTFFYDAVKPHVAVRAASRAKTKDSVVHFVVRFTEPVVGFNSSGVVVSGGSLTRITEVDMRTFRVEVAPSENSLVTVTVPQDSASDVAGNTNSGESSAQARHYTVPSISVMLYCLITVGLLSTALVSGMLSVASSTLAAANAIPAKRPGDPSRNLLGLICHLQVLALSGFLAVSLPVEYQEVTNGLRWLIPYVRTPWQAKSETKANSSTTTTTSTMLQDVVRGRRRLLSYNFGRALGENATLHGPALGPGDYQRFFLSEVAAETSMVDDYNGWQEFQRNAFWIGVVGGGLIVLHVLMVLFLRWRTKAPIRGALTIPRFELYLVILFVPGLCQASAFAIRGSSPASITVGGSLLAVPVAFLVSVLIFLVYGVFMGMMVQYREYRAEVHRHGYVQPQKGHGITNLVAGTGFPGKWIRSNRLTSTFLPRYSIIFEDLKGPPTILVHKKPQNLRHSIKRSGSTAEEAGSNDVVQVSGAHRMLGDARTAYIFVELSRRITLGLVFGFFSEMDHSWIQVGVVLGVTAVQLVYLVVVKPFRRRGVQVVETIAILCELGVFLAATVLLAKGRPMDLNRGVGIFMLALLVLSFVALMVNEWYELLEQLLRLSTAEEPTLNDGLKKLARGLVLPFTPRHSWPRYMRPQRLPSSAPSSVAAVSKRVSPPHEIKPFPLPNPDSVVIQNRSVAQTIAIDVDSDPEISASDEIQPQPSSSRSIPRATVFSAEGSRRSSHRETDSNELRTLRELARASFSGRDLGTKSFSASPVTPAISPREGDENRYMRKRRQFQDIPHGPTRSSGSSNTGSGDSASRETGDSVSPINVPEMARLVTSPAVPLSNKSSPALVQSHSMNVRDTVIRPLEER